MWDMVLMVTRGQKRGFSLIEMILVFFMASTLLGVMALSLRRTIDREGPRGLAYAVASDLRAARAEAQRSGSLVAFCLPRGTGDALFARSAVTRKGEQRADVYRTHGYDGDFDAAIFAGGWQGAAPGPPIVPPLSTEWQAALDGQHAIVFRPDGSAFSPTLPRKEGHFPLLVGSAFGVGGTEAGLPTLNAVTDPFLVWISESGSVTVVENTTPIGPLPPAGAVPTQFAQMVSTTPPAGSPPNITAIRYLPSRVPGLEPGISQTYTQIHPEQREGADLEYGLATMELRASDPSGGPLYYELLSTPTKGAAGNFSVQGNRGRMNYTQRADGTGWDWTSVIAWRPPPGADPDTEYQFRIRVFNDRGLEDVIESGAGLLPVFKTLDSPRLAIQDGAGKVFLANIDGASIMEVTQGDQYESRPFFSPDGTRLFTFNDSNPSASQLIARNADGTGRRVLSDIPMAADEIEMKFDPLYAFAAYSFESPPPQFNFWELVPEEVLVSSGGSDGTDTYETHYRVEGPRQNGPSSSRTLKILHLNSQEELTMTVALSSEGGINWGWDGTRRFHINYQEYVPADEVPVPGPVISGPNPYIPHPGYKVSGYRTKQLLGYPPTIVDAGEAPAQPNFTGYNNSQWSDWVLAKYDTLEAGEGTYLRLKNLANGTNENLNVTDQVLDDPCWSSDGRSVIYICRDGAGNFRLLSRQLLASGGTASPQGAVTVLTQNGVSQPKLSPNGDFVYFLRDNRLWRCPVQENADEAVVRLSDKVVVNYAITR